MIEEVFEVAEDDSKFGDFIGNPKKMQDLYEFLGCEGVAEVSFRNAPALQCGSLRCYLFVVPQTIVGSGEVLGAARRA